MSPEDVVPTARILFSDLRRLVGAGRKWRVDFLLPAEWTIYAVRLDCPTDQIRRSIEWELQGSEGEHDIGCLTPRVKEELRRLWNAWEQ